MRHEKHIREREFSTAKDYLIEKLKKLYDERRAIEIAFDKADYCLNDPNGFLEACRLSHSFSETSNIRRIFYDTAMELLEAKLFYKKRMTELDKEIKKLEGEGSNGKR